MLSLVYKSNFPVNQKSHPTGSVWGIDHGAFPRHMLRCLEHMERPVGPAGCFMWSRTHEDEIFLYLKRNFSLFLKQEREKMFSREKRKFRAEWGNSCWKLGKTVWDCPEVPDEAFLLGDMCILLTIYFNNISIIYCFVRDLGLKHLLFFCLLTTNFKIDKPGMTYIDGFN